MFAKVISTGQIVNVILKSDAGGVRLYTTKSGNGYIEHELDFDIDIDIEKILSKNVQQGWHSATERPEESGEYIVICDGFERTPFRAAYDKVINCWSHEPVKWWCYPPKDDENGNE